ncbi:STAS domain-containing protein [Desulfobacter vibrioformis]|uniref:STAS domain-containing protein n=1 Tax=Desulfobacter vibrioformis TaxID=34031 RepID=UPI000551C5EE|nr:STAS domain-containing protein [Desulfobacter vibrioformis]
MISGNQDKNGNLVIKIEGSLSAYNAGDIKDRLLTGFTNHQGVILDINGVTECDTLGIQLLLSARKTAEMLNKTFNVTGDSPSVQDMLTGLGLEAEDFPCVLKED